MTAFIVYDSFTLACKANALLQRVAANIGNFQWKISPWRTDLLRFDAESLNEARTAQLIVFAWEDSRPFTNWIEQWLEQWALKRSVREGAVALLGGNEHIRNSAAATGLAEFAQKHGLELIFPGMTTPAAAAPELPRNGTVPLERFAQSRDLLANLERRHV
jgi:hypothetical protein